MEIINFIEKTKSEVCFLMYFLNIQKSNVEKEYILIIYYSKV